MRLAGLSLQHMKPHVFRALLGLTICKLRTQKKAETQTAQEKELLSCGVNQLQRYTPLKSSMKEPVGKALALNVQEKHFHA